jgi:hypothetical protein
MLQVRDRSVEIENPILAMVTPLLTNATTLLAMVTPLLTNATPLLAIATSHLANGNAAPRD